MSVPRPCPLCGNVAFVHYHSGCTFVECTVCGACGPQRKSGEKAVKLWNERVESSEVWLVSSRSVGLVFDEFFETEADAWAFVDRENERAGVYLDLRVDKLRKAKP